jgi:hypothetical protein
MQTIFDPSTRDDVLRRIDAVQPGSERQWGKMSAGQMFEHLARTLEMPAGRRPTNQVFIGKLISWIFKSQFLGEKPFSRNSPTGPEFIVKDDPSLEAGRAKVKAMLAELCAGGEQGCDGRVHAFFGPLTGAQWGVGTYKHVDHHLRQFGV